MKCSFCGNDDPLYFYSFNHFVYCRKCITLKNEKRCEEEVFLHSKKIHANLSYSLTTTQKKASDEILSGIKRKENIIVNAVCGAGKTELVYQSMEYLFNQNKTVGFAIPRKDVVIEIYNRLKKDYPTLKITCVYGGHHTQLNGQLVVLTTHQLFRYPSYFDLLILDEADAFPYYQNKFLETFLNQSVKGSIIYLSATMPKDIQKMGTRIVYVNRRFHQYPLPIPQFIPYHFFNKLQTLKNCIHQFVLKKLPCLIFVPTIDCGKKLEKKLHIPFVFSKKKGKEQVIDDFKQKKISCLLTTSILERGITIENVQVIVYEADHHLFNQSTLIQISGRVGRKKNFPNGNVFFLAFHKSAEIKQCIQYLKEKNVVIV